MKLAVFITSVIITLFCVASFAGQESADPPRTPSESSLTPQDYGDTFDWNHLGAIDFLGFLQDRSGGYDVHGTHVNWVKEEDLPRLIALLYSSEPCANVSSTLSSYLDIETSTVGNEAAFLIEGFREGHYPPRLNSTRPKPDRDEILRWYRESEASTARKAGTSRDPEGSFRPPDECGDPKTISQSYSVCFGRVMEVIDGDTLVLDLSPDRQDGVKGDRPQSDPAGSTTVQLVCVEAPPLSHRVGRAARERLVQQLAGQEVTILISPYQQDGAPLNVVIEIAGGHRLDEGVAQIELGLARYRDFGPYDIDGWLECHYGKAEDRARAAKLGIWGPE